MTLRRTGRFVLRAVYAVLVLVLMLGVLEVAARALGLGEPVLYYNDAAGGMRPLPDQRIERVPGVAVTIDALGYRSARPDTAGALRVLYLGDSVTWGGTRLDDAAIFPEVAAGVLRAEGMPAYAMNAGVNGTALVNHAERFRDGVDSVHAVVWLFPWSDAYRSYATVGPLWPARFRPRFALVEAVDQVLFRFWLPAFRARRPSPDPFLRPDEPAGREAFFQQVLADRKERNRAAARAVAAEARRRGVPLVVGVTPYLGEGGGLAPLDPEAGALLAALADSGAVVFDVAAALGAAAEPPPALYQDHVHFTEAGHRAVGDALGRLLLRHLYDPPASRLER